MEIIDGDFDEFDPILTKLNYEYIYIVKKNTVQTNYLK